MDSPVTFTAGSAIDSRQNIMNVNITDDLMVEETETFFMTLVAVGGPPGNLRIDPDFSVATVTIIDNDGECTCSRAGICCN